MNRFPRVLAVLPLLVACSGSTPDAPGSGTRSDAIIGGQSDQNNLYPSVVQLRLPGGYACTGSLIAPKLVLTARHCVSQNITQGIGCDIYGNSTNGDHVGSDYTASGIEVYTGLKPAWSATPAAKGAQIIHPPGKNLCNNDIALVVLNQAVAGTPIKLRLDYPPQVGELTTAVGYGITSDNLGNSGTRRFRGSVPVISVGKDWNEILGDAELASGQSICSGDSGGPLLSAGGAVVGIASRSGPCANAAYHPKFTRVDYHKNLILQAFAAAGASPSVETGTGTTITKKSNGQGPCTTGSECTSFLCKTGASSMCTTFCDTTTCPVGMVCQDSSTVIGGESQNLKLCGALTGASACENCRNVNCVNVVTSCINNASCNTLLKCVDACSDPTCVTNCIAANPAGAEDYDLLRYCSCEGNCSAECSNMCAATGTGGAGGAAGGSAGGASGTGAVSGAGGSTGGVAGTAGSAGAAAGPATGSSSDNSGGCNVSHEERPLPVWLLAALAAVFARRRRRAA